MSKSKWFRVATEGATTDGREITRAEIDHMAKTYSREKYGARIWLEHYRGMIPGGPFDALGDVLAIEAREVEGGKKALFAQIEPLPALVEMNKKGQKLYSSIEVHPNFPTTGGAYLFGLGVTDSPASLGTEVLKFSQTARANPFADRKTDKATLFSSAQEFQLELEAEASQDAEPGALAIALAKFSGVMEKLLGNTTEQPAAPVQKHGAGMPAEALAALNEVEPTLKAFADQQKQDAKVVTELVAKYAALKKEHDELVIKLSAQPQGPGRHPATGGDGYVKAEY